MRMGDDVTSSRRWRYQFFQMTSWCSSRWRDQLSQWNTENGVMMDDYPSTSLLWASVTLALPIVVNLEGEFGAVSNGIMAILKSWQFLQLLPSYMRTDDDVMSFCKLRDQFSHGIMGNGATMEYHSLTSWKWASVILPIVINYGRKLSNMSLD
jgi:hypothetical protein